MSNQFFSPGRFFKYFRFQINLLGRGYLLAYTAAFIISLIVSITLIAVELSDNFPRPFQEEYQAIVLFGLGVVSILMGTWMYARLNKKESIIGFLSVPASHFEKTTVSFILSFIVPAIVCLIFYLICEQAMFAYFRKFALPYAVSDYYQYSENTEWRYYGVGLWRQVLDMRETKMIVALFVSAYIATHSFYVMGSLIFRRFSFVFTSISLGLLIFISASLAVLLIYGFIGAEDIRYFDEYPKYLADHWFGIQGRDKVEQLLIYGCSGIFMLTASMLWWATYLKLKEKEVR